MDWRRSFVRLDGRDAVLDEGDDAAALAPGVGLGHAGNVLQLLGAGAGRGQDPGFDPLQADGAGARMATASPSLPA
ncbi:MAG: hypothetical protein U1F47_05240 [Hyphomicrobiales bacterium]